MGTSQSSNGPPSGVPLVPPWVDDPPGDGKPPEIQVPDRGQPDEVDLDAVTSTLAPAARFGSARNSLGRYAESGDRDHLRKGVGRYVSTGLGGGASATSRMAGTARAASSLYSVLGGGSDGGDQPRLNHDVLRDGSAEDTIKAVVDAVRPVDGLDDTEATRNSANDALTELVDRFPDADLLDLTEEQREFVLERFVSMDVYRRFALDVGKHIQDKAPSATVAMSRLHQAKEYIRETVIASFKRVQAGGRTLSSASIVRLVQSVLSDAFDVFSEYAE